MFLTFQITLNVTSQQNILSSLDVYFFNKMLLESGNYFLIQLLLKLGWFHFYITAVPNLWAAAP